MGRIRFNFTSPGCSVCVEGGAVVGVDRVRMDFIFIAERCFCSRFPGSAWVAKISVRARPGSSMRRLC